MLKIKHIMMTFNEGTLDEKRALKSINLQLKEGEFVTVIGGNGAGKSTLMNVISGNLIADVGDILLEENLTSAYSRSKKHSLRPGVTVKRREIFRGYLKTINLGLENRLNTTVGLLSGGERQALSLLMATFTEPDILLLDEHTAALDPA